MEQTPEQSIPASEEQVDKPFFPIAPYHYFKNTSYRSSMLSDRRAQLVRCGLNPQRNIFVGNFAGALLLEGHPGADCVPFDMTACGYPIVPEAYEKIFSHMTPMGYFNPVIDGKILSYMADIPFIPFEVTKACKTVCGSNYSLPKGKFLSVGRRTRSSRGGGRSSLFDPTNNNIQVEFIRLADGDTSTPTVMTIEDNVNMANFDISNIFIDSKHTVNKSLLGLFILPIGSVVWFWNNQKWTTCSVKTSKTKDGVMDFSLVEVAATKSGGSNERAVVFQTSGEEIEVHKTVSKMMESDTIRVAQKSIKSVGVKDSTYGTVRGQIMKMLCNEFGSEILGPVKTNLLQSSEHKTMKNVIEFADRLVSKTPSISVSLHSGSTMMSIWQAAIRAAEDQVPLYWDNQFVELGSGNISSILGGFGLHCYRPSSDNYDRTLSHLQMDPKTAKGLFKKVKVECSGTFVSTIKRTSKAKIKTAIMVEVPSAIANQPSNISKGLIEAFIQRKEIFSRSMFEEEDPSSPQEESIQRVDFVLDKKSLIIKR